MRSLVVVVTLLAASHAVANPAGKVSVCHYTGNARSNIINISANALPAHLAHGDHLVGPEVCDGIDNDCDGSIDGGIAAIPSSCGVGACASTGSITCQDGALVDDCAAGEPTAEVCDGIDNDCDGSIDGGIAAIPSTCGVGACASTGSVTCQGGSLVDDCAPGEPTAEECDGVDDDCDGSIDEDIAPIATSCGVGACASSGQLDCVYGGYADTCAPGEPMAEVCDGIDNDCDGSVDGGIAPIPSGCGVGACASTGSITCQGGALVDDCAPGEPTAEVCDAIDNNCDGSIDGGIPAVLTGCGVGACASSGSITCQGGALVDDCASGEPAAEECDGIDNDCDGSIDEGIAAIPSSCGLLGACASTATILCQGGGFVCVPGEPTAEVCDGIDNDCDGSIDEGIAAIATSCGVGACASSGQLECVDGNYADTCNPGLASNEVCDNGIDEDCNGDVDDSAACSDPVCGDGYVQDGGSITSLTFEWLATCGSSDAVSFYVNGALILTGSAPGCNCTPGIQSATVTDAEVLALFVNGPNNLRVVAKGAYIAWALVTIEGSGGSVAHVLADIDGGNDAINRNPNLCGVGYVFNWDESSTFEFALGEECDDGNLVSGDGCSSSCGSEVCGNERIDAGEECDDGNETDGDGCSATCLVEECGNGRIDAGEQCDDGNVTDGDGCSDVCQVEICGNGYVDVGEECDDGNETDGDGCGCGCMNTNQDAQNCGGCGNVCPSEAPNCSDGVCVATVCHAIGYAYCPTGATEFCETSSIDKYNSDHAQIACETCFGADCSLQPRWCDSSGESSFGWTGTSCGNPFWSFTDCAGSGLWAGQVSYFCYDGTYLGTWAP